jgi:hypothetical protein
MPRGWYRGVELAQWGGLPMVTRQECAIELSRLGLSISAMEIAIIALGVVGLLFAAIVIRQGKPTVLAERVPGHPDTFELWNEGPGTAIIVHADVVAPSFPDGTSIDDATEAISGLAVDARLRRDRDQWAKGASLEPLRRFEVMLPSATSLRIVYRGEGFLGSLATDTTIVQGGH